MDGVKGYLDGVDASSLGAFLRYLAEDPLPCRSSNVTLPGHERSTLDEADDYLCTRLSSWGYAIERESVPVQAFRRDESKPLAHQYSPPRPGDPWYTAHNVYGKKVGSEAPEELVLLMAHKDSQSWMGCVPGAYDNAVGVAALLEMARMLSGYAPKRSVWFLFCCEEHTPWTSVTAAERLAGSEYDVLAALNVDAIGGKPDAEANAGRKTNVTRYTTDEGQELAELMTTLNADYKIGLTQSTHRSDRPGDDDGSFVKAGIPTAILNVGSMPYGDAVYHTAQDTVARVDIENVRMATQLSLAFLLHMDRYGQPG